MQKFQILLEASAGIGEVIIRIMARIKSMHVACVLDETIVDYNLICCTSL